MKTGEQLKQEGVALVLLHAGAEWKSQCIEAAKVYISNNREILGEDLRRFCLECGCPEPHHVNSWPGLIQRLAAMSLIAPTGRFVKSKHPAAHGRHTQIWLSVNFENA